MQLCFTEHIQKAETIKRHKKDCDFEFTPDEVEEVMAAGDNTGCMKLKGASRRHEKSERPDEWPMRPELLELAGRYGLGTEW